MCPRALAVLVLVGLHLQGGPCAAQQPTTEGHPAAGAAAVVTLVDAGAEPRVPLRSRPSPGERTAVLVTMDMAVDTQRGDQRERVAFPTLNTTLDTTVTGVSPEGDISATIRTIGMSANATGLSAGSATALQGALASLTGATVTTTVSARGTLKALSLDVSMIPDAQARDHISAMLRSFMDAVVPWPEEAVGVGARWTVRRTAPQNGVSLFTIDECALVSMQGLAVTVACESEGTAPAQAVGPPDWPTGTLSMAISASGRFTGRLDSLARAAELRATMATVFDGAERPEPLRTETELRITAAPTTEASPQPDPAGTPVAVRPPGPVLLFNGRSLEGWSTERVDERRVTARDGVLRLTGDSGWLLAANAYHDFDLRFYAKVEPGSLGGVLLRMLPADGKATAGYEVRVADEEGRAGHLVRRRFGTTEGSKGAGVTVPVGAEWQGFRIQCHRDTLELFIDGQSVRNVRGLVQNTGRVGFHVERGAIEFRNIEIRSVPGTTANPIPPGVALPGKGVSVPSLLHEVKPQYTREALALAVQGLVLVELIVLADGTVGDVTVLRPLWPDLDAAAVAAVKQWRFRPGQRDGRNVPVAVIVEVGFALK